MTVKELRSKLFEIEDQTREITEEELAEMLEEPYGNHSTINITVQRIDVCDMLIACTMTADAANDGGSKWTRLHDKLKKQLKAIDKANGWG